MRDLTRYLKSFLVLFSHTITMMFDSPSLSELTNGLAKKWSRLPEDAHVIAMTPRNVVVSSSRTISLHLLWRRRLLLAMLLREVKTPSTFLGGSIRYGRFPFRIGMDPTLPVAMIASEKSSVDGVTCAQ